MKKSLLTLLLIGFVTTTSMQTMDKKQIDVKAFALNMAAQQDRYAAFSWGVSAGLKLSEEHTEKVTQEVINLQDDIQRTEAKNYTEQRELIRRINALEQEVFQLKREKLKK